ncbi:hypothetical protein D3C80_1808460 [compost metagenome]
MQAALLDGRCAEITVFNVIQRQYAKGGDVIAGQDLFGLLTWQQLQHAIADKKYADILAQCRRRQYRIQPFPTSCTAMWPLGKYKRNSLHSAHLKLYQAIVAQRRFCQ